jgi:glycosyltransferase involved in cell wall biosynthesis
MHSLQFLLITGIYPPDTGGPATYLPGLARYLVAQGHGVRVITLSDTFRYEIQDGVRVYAINRHICLPIRMLITSILIKVLSLNTNRIFSNGLFEETYLSGALRDKTSLAKVVGDPIWERYRNATNLSTSIDDFQNLEIPFVYRLQRRLLTRSLKAYTKITSPGAPIASLIESWDQHLGVSVIPNGVSCQSWNSIEIKWDLIAVSRLVSWKKLDLVIKAINNSDISLAIAGSGPEESRLKELSSRLNCKVEFLGQVEQYSINDLLSKSKIFVQVSEYEGMSFSMLQAMMQGKAIITSNIEANTQLIENGVSGLVVGIDDETELNQAIKIFIENPSLIEAYGEAARRKAKNDFCEEKQYRKMTSLMDA